MGWTQLLRKRREREGKGNHKLAKVHLLSMENHLAKAGGKSHPEGDDVSQDPEENVVNVVNAVMNLATNLGVDHLEVSRPVEEEDHLVAGHLAKRKDPEEGEEDLQTVVLEEVEEDHRAVGDNADHRAVGDADLEDVHHLDRSEEGVDEDLLNRVTLSGERFSRAQACAL